jgi:hypothetical protein
VAEEGLGFPRDLPSSKWDKQRDKAAREALRGRYEEEN